MSDKPVSAYERVPDELKALKQWCLYDEKKVPLTPNGKPCPSNDPDSWATFMDACNALSHSRSRFRGIGFMFAKGGGYVGIDLDDCIRADGSLKTWAFKILSQIGCGYVEYSPSGKGLHIIVRGSKPGPHCKHIVANKSGVRVGEIELYDERRYFTVSGKIYDDSLTVPVDATQQIQVLYDKLFGQVEDVRPPLLQKVCWNVSAEEYEDAKRSSPAADHSTAGARTEHLTPEEIVKVIERSEQGEKWKRLNSGTLEDATAEYDKDHSRAVFAWSAILAWYTGDFSQADILFRHSPLYSGKWAPDGESRSGAARVGKWARLGESQFLRLRRGYEANGDTFNAEDGRTSPQADFTDLTDEGRQKELSKGERDMDKYVSLLWDAYEDARRDLFTGSLHVRKDDEWTPVGTKAVLQALKGDCQMRKGYKPNRLENYLFRYERESRPQLLVDVESWDGTDRIAEMCSMMNLVAGGSDVSREEMGRVFTEIVKDWGARMWGKIVDPEGVQNRCIILSGNQGIGKDIWIKTLIGGLAHYVSDMCFDGKFTKETDVAVVMQRSAVLFISEFDKTHDLGIAVLKDLITKGSFTHVRKYDRESTKGKNRCSLIGACNPSDVLRDATGNRRFCIFHLEGGPKDAIRWDYPVQDRDYSNRILSQMKALWESGYKASSRAEEVMAGISAKYTPEDPRTELVEEFEEMCGRLEDPLVPGKGLFTLEELENILQVLCRNFGYPRRTVLCILKQAGCQFRTATKRLYGTRKAAKRRLTGTAELLDGEIDENEPFDSEIQ